MRIFLFLALFIIAHSGMAQPGTNALTAGARLTEGQRLISANKNYYLTMQADGNLCIYTSNNSFVWCSMMYFGKGSSLNMQTDGNLVVYDGKNKAVWSSMTQAWFDPKFSTAEWKPVRVVLENNGTLNLYNAANKKVWGNTDKPAPPIVSPGVGYTGPVVQKKLKVKLPGSDKASDINVEVTEQGDVMYHGDMRLGNVDDLTKKASSPTPEPEDSYKWPNSTVHYVLPGTHPLRSTIQKAIDYMNVHTTICLVPRTNQTAYVEFITGTGNWADIGRTGEKQSICMTDDNMVVVIHEIMHTLGFHHTQCRQDRDNYVTIHMGNVQKGKEHNFEKSPDPQSNLGAYDYNSIMHYFSSAFANRKGAKTISRKDGKTDEMGKFDAMSQTDVNNIAAVYPACSGKVVKPLPATSTTPATNPATTPTTPTPGIDPCEAKYAVKKYQNAMKPGERLGEKEKLVSANNRYHFRITSEGNFVIEEIQDLNNCRVKEVYRFALVNGGSKPAASFFSYNPDGNLCMDSKLGKTHCATTGRDAIANVILHKSAKLELTDDGRLRLVNANGQEIWATSASRTAPAPAPTGTRTAPTTTSPTTSTRTGPTATTPTTTVRTAPATQPTSTVRTAPAKMPYVDNTPAVSIPAYTPKSGEYENVVNSEAGADFQVTAKWIGFSENGASWNGPQQAIDGHRTNSWSEEPQTCKSGEAQTPGWEVDLGRVVYVEYIQIWNSADPSSLNGRNFYVTFATSHLGKRGIPADPANGLPYLWEKDQGADGNNVYNKPLGPYKWQTGQKSMIIPIKKNVKMLNIKLQKDGINTTPLTLEEVEIYGKELPKRSR